MTDKEEVDSTEPSTSADDLARSASEATEPAGLTEEETPVGDRNGNGSAARVPGSATSSGGTAVRTATAKTAAAPSKGAATDAKGKGRATPKRDVGQRHHRTGPVQFVRESIAELRKVVYPTGQQLGNYFVVVLIFVLFIIAYVSLLDLGLGAAIFRLFA